MDFSIYLEVRFCHVVCFVLD